MVLLPDSTCLEQIPKILREKGIEGQLLYCAPLNLARFFPTSHGYSLTLRIQITESHKHSRVTNGSPPKKQGLPTAVSTYLHVQWSLANSTQTVLCKKKFSSTGTEKFPLAPVERPSIYANGSSKRGVRNTHYMCIQFSGRLAPHVTCTCIFVGEIKKIGSLPFPPCVTWCAVYSLPKTEF